MSDNRQEALEIMSRRFGKDSIISVATIDGGVPHVRCVDAIYERGAFFIVTHRLSGKMRQIEENPLVAVCGEWFTGHGRGVDMGFFGSPENAAVAARLRQAFAAWIDNGHSDLTDENTRILRIDLTDGVLMADGERFEPDFSADRP